MSRDEGVIKFDCRWTHADPTPDSVLDELIYFRDLLFDMNLIGVYSDGIGFGNVSARVPNAFVISASQTGHIARTNSAHYSRVTKYSVTDNWVECVGPMPASSESLTHAMIYDVFPAASAVLHIHNRDHWDRLLGVVPTTGREIAYGTPAMAREIELLARSSNLSQERIFAMAGHEDGIVAFGGSLTEALAVLSNRLGLPFVSRA